VGDVRSQNCVALYERFADDLRGVRAEQRELYERSAHSPMTRLPPYRWSRTAARKAGLDWEKRRWINPQLDDIEAELTYLRIRDRRPEQVIEISPFRGWSTTWILRALRDNGTGNLVSFDLVEDSALFVPAELGGRWRLVIGDVREQLAEMPAEIDYLFLDSDHRAAFARWFVAELFPRLAPGAGVSVHDIFHSTKPRSGEARVLLAWLEQTGTEWFTPSRLAPAGLHDEIQAQRRLLHFDAPIHSGDHDSMVFFDAA